MVLIKSTSLAFSSKKIRLFFPKVDWEQASCWLLCMFLTDLGQNVKQENSYSRELLVSYNDELIYLFQKNMGLGPNPLSMGPQECEDPQVYLGHRNSEKVKGVNFFGPNGEYVVSGSDCGHVFIWKKKDGDLVRLIGMWLMSWSPIPTSSHCYMWD